MSTTTDPKSLDQRWGALSAEFHPHRGGRLARLRYGGTDLVLPFGQVPGYDGDTFWPSPQSRWDWPPPPVLDAQPYEVRHRSERELVMRSGVDHNSGLQVDKRFVMAQDGITCGFTMTNTSDVPNQVAPWQVTRAPREGLLVWAPGQPFDDADRLHKQQVDPGSWYAHTATAVPFAGHTTEHGLASLPVGSVVETSKFFTDARGWVAHIHQGVIFLRVFPDLTPEQMAPQQAELELFFGLERDYIELENQGAFESLAPGASLTYEVRWHFGHVPPGVPDDRLTPELRDVIQALLTRR
jgi:hypothetical protein